MAEPATPIPIPAPIPINVLTGFLGAGKTTLLRRMLAAPGIGETAVLINEFGEVGLDHHLIEHAAESTLVLENGCVCCAIRGDLKAALRDLLSRRERGEVPRFTSVVIETSGLADPVPIAYTVIAEPVIRHHYRIGNVLTVVDAVNGAAQIERFPESVKQVAVADRILITKTDLAGEDQVADLRAALGGINAAAEAIDCTRALPAVEDLLAPGAGDEPSPQKWMHAAAPTPAHAHASGVASFTLWFEGALDWTAFGIWLTMLLNRHGETVLRVKGMLNVAGVADPVLINGVQHLVHPPAHLARWPDGDRRSRIVFIVRDMDEARIRRSLAAFNALADRGCG